MKAIKNGSPNQQAATKPAANIFAFPGQQIIKRNALTEPEMAFFTGMTLLDHFAGQVMPYVFLEHHGKEEFSYENVARQSYNMAQAMLEARQKHFKKQ